MFSKRTTFFVFSCSFLHMQSNAHPQDRLLKKLEVIAAGLKERDRKRDDRKRETEREMKRSLGGHGAVNSAARRRVFFLFLRGREERKKSKKKKRFCVRSLVDETNTSSLLSQSRSLAQIKRKLQPDAFKRDAFGRRERKRKVYSVSFFLGCSLTLTPNAFVNSPFTRTAMIRLRSSLLVLPRLEYPSTARV